MFAVPFRVGSPPLYQQDFHARQTDQQQRLHQQFSPTPLAPRSANTLYAHPSGMSPTSDPHSITGSKIFNLGFATPPSPPETPTSHRGIAQLNDQENQENPASFFSSPLLERRPADWLQPCRSRREELNPLVRSTEQRRVQRRAEFFVAGQRRRDERVMGAREDQILQSDAIAQWREWQQEQALLAQHLTLEEDGLENDLVFNGQNIQGDMDTDSAMQHTQEEPSVEEIEALMLSQDDDFYSLVAMHQDESPQHELPAWDTTDMARSSSPPRSQHWGSDDDDFEQLLLQLAQADDMDMS